MEVAETVQSVEFPNLVLCQFELPERWESGRRHCTIGNTPACACNDPKQCKFAIDLINAARNLRVQEETKVWEQTLLYPCMTIKT